MQMISFWKKSKKEKQAAERLYAACCDQARQPFFYQKAGVPDNVQGRFEMVAVHLWLMMRHLRRLGAHKFAQHLSAAFFFDMDAAMREKGVGDLAVPRHIKNVAQAFYGRLLAYDQALDHGNLSQAFGRNLSKTGALTLAQYFTQWDQQLTRLKLTDFQHNLEFLHKKIPN